MKHDPGMYSCLIRKFIAYKINLRILNFPFKLLKVFKVENCAVSLLKIHNLVSSMPGPQHNWYTSSFYFG